VSYSIKNLRDVEDSAPKFGFGEIGEARFPRGDLEAERTGFAYHRIRAGKAQAFAHRHDEAEEVVVVLSGRGQAKLDDDVRDIGPLDAIRIAPGVLRSFRAGPDETLELLVFGAHHEGDGELVTDYEW
jgi:mannose-6-phosphate isomerase-like protein (cupin superfamily)